MSLDTWREELCRLDIPQSKLYETEVDLDEDWHFWKMESSTSKINMNKHENVISEKKKPQDCPICDYRFKTKSGLKNHIDAIHEGKKPHKCSICDCSFVVKDKLIRHVNSVHQDEMHTATKGSL